jgi:hypothetical protein
MGVRGDIKRTQTFTLEIKRANGSDSTPRVIRDAWRDLNSLRVRPRR